MCNHYRNIADALSTWHDYIGWAQSAPDFEEDVWPRRQALIIRQMGDRKGMDAMAWGIPLSLPGKRPGVTTTKYVTNVRNLDSGFWRATLATASQRCLVPFSAFAEPIPGRGREEFWARVTERRSAAFAGIWRAGPAGNAFAFLTCAPNPMIAAIHPKAMPVILDPDDYDGWLDGDDARRFAQPFPSQLMSAVQ